MGCERTPGQVQHTHVYLVPHCVGITEKMPLCCPSHPMRVENTRVSTNHSTANHTLCNFLPFFLPPVKRTIIVVIFFQIFQGFTLGPWQKVGRICLGFAGNPSSFPISPLFACISVVKFFPSPSPYSNDMAPNLKSLIFPLWFGSQTLHFSFRLFKTQLLV